ncbi:CRAL-TRIO domain-containing protein [Aphelenchoides fujianensis]|nr:CRAL-TRIO domain-containing protein [Aphelenchoides fujianensis]
MFDEKQEERVEALRKRIQNVSCSQAFFDLFLLFSNPNASKYHPADLKRAELEDWWLDSFLRSRNNDIDVAAAVFFECLKWRQTFGVHSIGFLELRAAFENAFIYFRGNDLDGNRLLWINFERCQPEEAVNQRLLSPHLPLKFIPKAVGGEDEFVFTISELARSTGSPNAKIRRFSHPNTQARVKPLVEKKKVVKFGRDDLRFVDNNRPVSIFDRSIDWQYRSFMAVAPKRSLVLNYEPNGENSVNLILQSNSAWFIYFNIGINSRRCLEVSPERGILEPTERTVVTIRAKESIRTAPQIQAGCVAPFVCASRPTSSPTSRRTCTARTRRIA